MPWKRWINAVLEQTIGYQLSRPLTDRAWKLPAPRAVNALLVRVTGYQLSRPLADRAWNLPPAQDRRLLRAPVFVFSAPRSGSTLLRVILGSHPDFYAPPELPLKHLGVRAETTWIRAAMAGLELTGDELDYMLWDRVLADALQRSGKPRIVVKTPSNILIWDRIAACWPDARFIFLLRHPAATVASLHSSFDPAWRPEESGTLAESVARGLRYMTVLEQARGALPGLTIRYEDLTAEPRKTVSQLCAFLGVPFQPSMLDYGSFGHAGFTPGLGDSSLNIRSGRIQPPAPLPDEIPEELTDICAKWGYLAQAAPMPSPGHQWSRGCSCSPRTSSSPSGPTTPATVRHQKIKPIYPERAVVLHQPRLPSPGGQPPATAGQPPLAG
jgi:Sulfotransferase family